MARTVTRTAIKRIMSRGLSGREAGRLILQDSIDLSCGMPPTLTDTDMAAIRSAPLQGKDVRDFNTIMALARAFEKGVMLCEVAWKDACLDLSFLIMLLRDADRRRTVELFTSFGPHMVSQKQYDDVVADQRQKKLESEYNLGYILEERFYAIASPEAGKDIDDLCVDIESAEEFVAALPQEYSDWCEQAFEQIRKVLCSGKLKATYYDEDAKAAKSLLAKWKKKRLAPKEAARLLDMLCVTGQQLYDCEELPEWKTYMEKYQRHVHGDDDVRFRHAYAILEDCPEQWLDSNGYYKDPLPPSKWITRHTEQALGLRTVDDGEDIKTTEEARGILGFYLDSIESNIRLFLAVKAILEAALEAAELDTHGDAALTAQGDERLKPYIEEYHNRLARVKRDAIVPGIGEARLEKVLIMLPAIDLEKLTPTPESTRGMDDSILSGVQGDAWFKTKLGSLEYADKFKFDTWRN